MNLENRAIYCRDNIDVLVAIDTEIVDMIYLDLPFNKNKSLTIPLRRLLQDLRLKIFFTEKIIKRNGKKNLKPHIENYMTFYRRCHFIQKIVMIWLISHTWQKGSLNAIAF